MPIGLAKNGLLQCSDIRDSLQIGPHQATFSFPWFALKDTARTQKSGGKEPGPLWRHSLANCDTRVKALPSSAIAQLLYSLRTGHLAPLHRTSDSTVEDNCRFSRRGQQTKKLPQKMVFT